MWRVVAGSELRARWNRWWRFSTFRWGIWLLLAEAGLLALVVWQGDASALPGAGLSPLLLVAAQGGVSGMVRAFVRGREALYTLPHLAVAHLSPARPESVIVGQALADVPDRVWEQLLVAVATVSLLPAEAGLWQVGLLWLVGVMAGSLGWLSGVLVLILWTRWAPRGVTAATFAVVASVAGVGVYAAYLVATGFPDALLDSVLGRLQGWLPFTLVAVLAPGFFLAGGLLICPRWIGGLYRESWLSSREAMLQRGAMRRPRWLSPLRGPSAAVHTSGWLQIARNPFSLVRLGFWAAGLLALRLFTPIVGQRLPPGGEVLAVGLGMGLAFVVGGEVVAAVFDADGLTSAWYRVAGMRPVDVLWGKVWAVAPLAPMAALNAWTAAWTLGAGAEGQLRAATAAAGLGLGTTLVILGVAAVGAGIAVSREDSGADLLSAALEQVPRSMASWSALLAGVAHAALGLACLASGRADATCAAAVLVLVPMVAVGLGWVALRRRLL